MLETDQGQWMIVHPAEIVATFLLPLPDPIPLSDGIAIPSYHHPSDDAIELLEPWMDKLCLQGIDHDSIVPCSEMLIDGSEDSPPVNWSNKWLLRASIQFHQEFSDVGLRVGLEPAMKMARLVSGPVLGREDKVRESDMSAIGHVWGPSELRQKGMGSVTVAECYVGLRIVGDIGDLPELLGHGDVSESPFGPVDSDWLFRGDAAMWQWRVFPPGSEPDRCLVERRVRYALQIALTELRSIQRGVHLLRRAPTIISSLERLPIVIPVVLRTAAAVGDESEPPLSSLLATHSHVEPLRLPPALDDKEMAALSRARDRVDGGAFAAHVDLHREGHVALTRHGDRRLACLLFGVAAESLLDELILHLRWEEGHTPEEVAQSWVDGLRSRIRAELPRRLGGSWDLTGRNPVGTWHQDVASVRHRVAHAGYTPTEDEGRRSLDAINDLLTYVCDRLATPKVLGRYPRTALSLAAEAGLERRQAHTKRIRQLQHDPSEVGWDETFYRWREAWRRCRQDQTSRPRVPDEGSARLLAVLHPNDSLAWVRHDRVQHLAVEVDVNEGAFPAGFVDELYALVGPPRVGSQYRSPISIAIDEPVDTVYRPHSSWVEEYHHVPMTQVMVDGSDYGQ